MFSTEELQASLADMDLRDDLIAVRRLLATFRLKQEVILDSKHVIRLEQLVEAVLSSASRWEQGEGTEIILRAAEVAELLAVGELSEDASRARLRASLLYELAELPMMAAAIYSAEDGPEMLTQFFRREGPFSSLGFDIEPKNGSEPDFDALLPYAAAEDALGLARFEHSVVNDLTQHEGALAAAASRLQAGMTLTEVRAFSRVVRRRGDLATRNHAPVSISDALRQIHFPPELWGAQATAVKGGILNAANDAWGLAAPTGTGKTFLSRLVILNALSESSDARVLYLVPTRALVSQVASDLDQSLGEVGINVTSVTPQLAALDAREEATIAGSHVLVLTPEKADMLLRIGAFFLGEVSLVIVDEAHHLEEGTRGVLLELYLARLRHALHEDARYVLLSAVAPNIREITNWIGSNPGSALVEDRSTRMKVGVYRVRKEGSRNRGVIEYMDGTEIRLFERGIESSGRKRLVQLAGRIATAGPLLIIAEGPGTAESVAAALQEHLRSDESHRRLTDEELSLPVTRRLDSRLEREMYPDVPLREMFRDRVAYHHAGLPPRVREVVEQAIKANVIRYVVATTTLAEGVNFPFSTVIVETLAVRSPSFESGVRSTFRPVTPRAFWNIAGRAGRPGYDHEGQVILFDQGLRLEHAGGDLQPYTNPEISDIPPVQSALASGISDIRQEMDAGDLDLGMLAIPEDTEDLPRRTQGIVNLLRVGLAHAKATGIDESAAEYFDSTFAAQQMPESDRAFARRLMRQQFEVLEDYLQKPDSASVELVAELGLSISTLSKLRRYVRELEDWQLERFRDVLHGPQIYFNQIKYVLGPVLARMSELEGQRLGGMYSELVMEWCRGKPFTQLRRNEREDTLEKLIRLLYSRIQYILPWGLYAMDRFVAEETEKRSIDYDNEINLLAYLVDAGVPDLAALSLTRLDFERTDAARLSRVYLASSEASETTKIEHWLRVQPPERLAAIVRGQDHRPLDFDFRELLKQIPGPGS
ncbi:MAG TPA: DEAD/DEAH box helicase [Solirubrobacterales bacterium]|nr:DEAD/DEAH box helicase [Solirubrobacterales bacterium]